MNVACASCGGTRPARPEELRRPQSCSRCGEPLLPPQEPVRLAHSQELDALIHQDGIGALAVLFTSHASMPCRVMAPNVDAFARRFSKRVTVVSVDAEAFPELAERFHIEEVPTVLLLRDGRELVRLPGLFRAEELAEHMLRVVR